ncbi:hypothetical protein LTR17_010839 [Elasticomyces elasticus]|nr:hypothetical protein LTR17_010839 [Elasticomyces elasticus]
MEPTDPSQESLDEDTEAENALSSDQSQSRLLSLPAEVLSQPGPVAAYMSHRTILRNTTSALYARKPDQQMRAFRQARAFPTMPPLALVCKNLAEEIVVYYLKHNIFQFHIEYNNDKQVARWLKQVDVWCHKMMPYLSKHHCFAEPCLMLRVGFAVEMRPLIREYALVEYKVIGTTESELYDLMDVRLGGLLLKECNCWARGVIEDLTETYDEGRQLSEFTSGLECRIQSFWLHYNSHAESGPCLVCGLPRYGADMRVDHDRYEYEAMDNASTNKADATAKCYLLGLPPELREMIWSLVLVRPEPIIAYVNRRTTLNPDRNDPEESRTKRYMQAFPHIPPLASVSRDLYMEIMDVYFGNNTFLFSLNKQNPGEIDSWLELVRAHNYTIMGSGETWPAVDYQIKIELNFMMPDSSYYERPTTIAYSFNAKKDAFNLDFHGALARECLCRLYSQLNDRYPDETGEWDDLGPMSAFTKLIECWVRLAWLSRNPMSIPQACRRCAKQRFYGRHVDLVDHAFDRMLGNYFAEEDDD